MLAESQLQEIKQDFKGGSEEYKKKSNSCHQKGESSLGGEGTSFIGEGKSQGQNIFIPREIISSTHS